MPRSSDEDGAWLHPQWFVSGFALAALGLIASYDRSLGLAAAVVLGALAVMWLYIAVRFGALSGAPSGRGAVVAQFREQASNRRMAAARIAPHALAPSIPQKRAQPPEGAGPLG